MPVYELEDENLFSHGANRLHFMNTSKVMVDRSTGVVLGQTKAFPILFDYPE